jgi:uncharacterized damage-inducible protein DinB
MNKAANGRVQTIYRHASSPKGEGLRTNEPNISDIERGNITERKSKLQAQLRKQIWAVRKDAIKHVLRLGKIWLDLKEIEREDLEYLNKDQHTKNELRIHALNRKRLERIIRFVSKFGSDYSLEQQRIRWLIIAQISQ